MFKEKMPEWIQASEGLKIYEDKKSNVLIASISSIDENFKCDFRSCFSAICHGDKLSAMNGGNYTYIKTLNEFITRYDKAPTNIKTGMIGEMVVHLLVRKLWTNYTTIIPYFNLEDRNIKKGFDSLIYSQENGVWAAEVKSGKESELNIKSLDAKSKELLKIADTDISKKLNNQDDVQRLWGLAMNGFQVACDKSDDEKASIEKLILDHQDVDVESNVGGASSHNVILSSVVFCECKDDVSIEVPVSRHDEFREKYSNLYVISIKKCALDLLVEFINEEVTA